MTKQFIPIKSHPKFKQMLRDLKIGKFKLGQMKKDGRPLSDRRLTLAITRVPGLQNFILNQKIDDDE